MKKLAKTIAMIFGIFLISLASALTYNITAGDSVTLTLPEEYDYYSVVGNLTPIELELEQSGLNVTITIGKYTQTDSFELIFFNLEKEIITQYSSGGTRTIYEDKIVEVDKYLDREIDITNDTEIEILNDKINKLEEDKKNKEILNNVMRIILGILLLILIVIVGDLLKKKKQNEKKTR